MNGLFGQAPRLTVDSYLEADFNRPNIVWFYGYDKLKPLLSSPENLGVHQDRSGPRCQRSAYRTKLRLLWVTSLRDIGREDQNGRWITIPEGSFYMMGLLEALIRRLNGDELTGTIFRRGVRRKIKQSSFFRQPHDFFSSEVAAKPTPEMDLAKGLLMLRFLDNEQFAKEHLELAGVVIDDTEEDVARGRLAGYTVMPAPNRDWLLPRDATFPSGDRMARVSDYIYNIPSAYRHIVGDEKRKRESKARFEDQLFDLMQTTRADIIILDHAMFVVNRLLSHYDLKGRILNNHPAITETRHRDAVRGCHPTRDSISKARSLNRWLTTGATTHMIDLGIDSGPVVVCGGLTTVYPNDEPQQLRFRNYAAKMLVFFLAIEHYARNLHPFLPVSTWPLSLTPSRVLSVELLEMLQS